jgi:hypothetical protein
VLSDSISLIDTGPRFTTLHGLAQQFDAMLIATMIDRFASSFSKRGAGGAFDEMSTLSALLKRIFQRLYG